MPAVLIRPVHRRWSRCCAVVVFTILVPTVARAHHAGHELASPSPTCGWLEGETLRDRSNLAEFCSRSVASRLRIRSAAADRERLWLEASPDLASMLRGDDRSTAALLRTWLEQWRTISGYENARIALMRGHVEFARVQPTMKGDVVSILQR